MRLRLIEYLKQPDTANFELKLLVLINLLTSLLAFFSILANAVLTLIQLDSNTPNLEFIGYKSLFWLVIMLFSLLLAEFSLHHNHAEIARKLEIYLFSFFFIPLGLYISGSVTTSTLFYLLCIIMINILARPLERFIINPFLILFILTYMVISFQLPEYLPAEPDKNLVFIRHLLYTPVLIGITIFLVIILIESFRREHNRLSEQKTKLEQLVKTDILTGLYNKSYLNEQLPKLLHNAYRKESPLAIFIIDIDFFKHYNTLYGNIKGDSCLLEVATILRQNCSNITEHIYRFGGEEFAMLIPGANQDSARILAESIREDFHIRQIDNYRSTICNYITVSIGIHCYSGQNPTTPDEVIKKADSALYTVKRQGRDNYYIDTSSAMQPINLADTAAINHSKGQND